MKPLLAQFPFALVLSSIACATLFPGTDVREEATTAPAILTPAIAASLTPETASTPALPDPPTAEPSPEEPLLGQTLALVTVSSSETSQTPPYALTVERPELQGSGDPRVLSFNQQITGLFEQEIAAFKRDVEGLPNPPMLPGGSFFELGYSLASPPGAIVSLRILANGYYDGAAHPYHYTRTFTYDLTAGQTVALSQLFLPGVPYLDLLAAYSQAELSAQDALMFEEGAAPTEENYRNWVLTGDGIEITFDEYQVAPYAMGALKVVVPYAELEASLDFGGPIGRLPG